MVEINLKLNHPLKVSEWAEKFLKPGLNITLSEIQKKTLENIIKQDMKELLTEQIIDANLTVLSESDLLSSKVIRFNKRGKTCVILLENKVEVTLKFPTAKVLAEFLKSMEKTK